MNIIRTVYVPSKKFGLVKIYQAYNESRFEGHPPFIIHHLVAESVLLNPFPCFFSTIVTKPKKLFHVSDSSMNPTEFDVHTAGISNMMDILLDI